MAASAPDDKKTPRTERGRKTLRKLLDAAAGEFGDHGFHEASVSSITRRAGVALGTFYTYFDSKDALFRALVRDMSGRVKEAVAPSIADIDDPVTREGAALEAFLGFARDHKEIYRIIDEAEFVDTNSFRRHYASTAERIARRLAEGAARGDLRQGIGEAEAWAIMGMNVFLGLRYGVWAEDRATADVADAVAMLLAQGIGARTVSPD